MTLKLETFFESCDHLIKIISSSKEELILVLSQYETRETVEDEIQRSLDTLAGLRKEFSPVKSPLESLTISTFFPLNLPLYSLVLFGIAPSAFSHRVYIRPPEVMQKILLQLWPILEMDHLFENISLKSTPRHIFVQLYASESDVIIFTGKYTNALDIHEKCPGSVLLYNGSGVNPFLLFDNANVNQAVHKAIEMRCFNSGQDCAGPDIFLVPSNIADSFTNQLVVSLKEIKVGATTNPSSRIGPTMKKTYIDELQGWLSKESDNVVLKGEIDTKNHFVHPIVVRKNIEQHVGDFHEFFAPLFYILEYSSDEELLKLIGSHDFRKRGMYVSVFGSNPTVEKKLDTVKILRNEIVNDIEYGNDEYGGYGEESNFILKDGLKTIKPILVSRDIYLSLAPHSYEG
jgi:acyl-CoA reductase-like NAD-dependent aldehyde dehydrogenase